MASFAAPPLTSARSAGSLRGTGVGSQAERKTQIEVARELNPLAAGLWDDVFGQKRGDFDG